MSQWCIQIGRFIGYLDAVFLIFRILDLPHYVYTVGNHNKDYTHILCKGEEQVTEVFRFDSRTFCIQLIGLYQSCDNTRNILSKLTADSCRR